MNQIENRFGIARSTLSGWFKHIKLTPTQKRKLLKNSKVALIEARKKAVLWHNAQKQKRIDEAKRQALVTFKNININNSHICELALALLYLGEGAKKTIDTSIGSSDPLILKFFIAGLKKIYNFDTAKIRCELHLRADQDPEKIKCFWARELKLPLASFKHTNIDKRTLGSKTYSHYMGVCNVRCGNVAIQRRLMCLSELFCTQIIKKHMGS